MSDTTNLTELIQQATQHLIDLRYSEGTIYRYRLVWKHFRVYAETRNHKIFSLKLGEAFLLDYYGIKPNMKLSESQVFNVRCIKVLEEYHQHNSFQKCHQSPGRQVPNQYINIFEEYIQLQKELQLSKRTLQGKKIQIIDFLSYIDKENLIGINNLMPEVVMVYLETLSKYASATRSGILFTLRDFLAFLFSKGYTESPLNQLFPVIFTNKFERIPSYYSIEEIQRILKQVDRSSEIGRRDYVVLLLAIQLGIRAGDIRKLKFDNIKWHLDTIEFVQEKTNNPIRLPLVENLKYALIDYIKNSRPITNDPHIFIRHRAPFIAFTKGNVFWSIINKYMDTAGITINRRKHGLHSMRHSMASNLLKNNTPYPVITGVLGHENSNTTKLYLRIDIEQLRTVALEVPYER
ncbi:site-specific integrase [Bacillus dakarensis]|uniref:site-specific integrase n=1 Tax=Robertmurraya dakarensis TaxID=1926278 RepID=UPI0009823C12|nr:site-specific integrase [Bacillus dakarensis]